MSALQRELAKSKVQPTASRKAAGDFPWPEQVWEEAHRDLKAGTFKTQPAPRIPIIITPNSPVSSAEKLQQLAELPSLPEIIEADQLEGLGYEKTVVGRARFCHVSVDELERLKDKAEVLHGMLHNTLVMFDGRPRYAMVVKSLKDGVILEEQNGSGMQDKKAPKQDT
ncbi:hypothetical protein VTK56DRAFT_1675 [Thermocarpiscus australiensis]